MASAQAQMANNGPASSVNKLRVAFSIGSALVAVCAGLIIWSPRFSAFTSVFLRLQLPADVPRGVGPVKDLVWADRDWFSVGWLDVFTVLCYAVVVLLTTTAFDDGLGTRIMTSSPDPLKMSRLFVHLLFEIGSFTHAIWATWRGHFGWNQIWNGYANSEMPFIAKFFFAMQTAYYMHVLLYNALTSVDKDDSVPSRKHIFFNLFVHIVATAFAHNSLLPAVIVLMIPHTVLSIANTLSQLFDNSSPAGQNPRASTAEFFGNFFKYATLLEYLWLVVGAVIMCCLGDTNAILLRLAIVISALFWGIWGGLTFYFEEQQKQLQSRLRPSSSRSGGLSGKKPKAKVAAKRRQ